MKRGRIFTNIDEDADMQDASTLSPVLKKAFTCRADEFDILINSLINPAVLEQDRISHYNETLQRLEDLIKEGKNLPPYFRAATLTLINKFEERPSLNISLSSDANLLAWLKEMGTQLQTSNEALGFCFFRKWQEEIKSVIENTPLSAFPPNAGFSFAPAVIFSQPPAPFIAPLTTTSTLLPPPGNKAPEL